MENNNEKSEINKKPSTISILGNIGMNVGNKLGMVVTEFFTGKQPTLAEKAERELKKSRLKQLKAIQDEVQFQKDLELAKEGKYVPPVIVEKKVEIKKKEPGIFDNIGKYNPIEDFTKTKSLGNTDVVLNKKIKKISNQPDFGIDIVGHPPKMPNFGFDGVVNSTKHKNGGKYNGEK